jgi:hypothetical protein
MGDITAFMQEESNVDLAAEFIEMTPKGLTKRIPKSSLQPKK